MSFDLWQGFFISSFGATRLVKYVLKKTHKRPVSWSYSNERYKQYCPWDMLKQQYVKCSVFIHGYWRILIVIIIIIIIMFLKG